MSQNEYSNEIHSLIISKIFPNENHIDYELSLKDHGLDSFKLVEIIVAIEENYNFEFDETDLDMSNFVSINKISELVKRKCQTKND